MPAARPRLIPTLFCLSVLAVPQAALARDSRAPQRDVPAKPAEVFAILIGIGDYPGFVNDLPHTHKEPELVRQSLAGVLAEKNCWAFTNREATREHVLDALDEIAQRAGPEDTVILYYSGHGNKTEPDDANTDEADRCQESLVLYDGELMDDELSDCLDEIDSRLTLLAIHACFSGGFEDDCIDGPGRIGIFSSSEHVVTSAPYQGGWLPQFLVAAFGGAADGAAVEIQGEADGMITALELETYIMEQWNELEWAQGRVAVETLDGARAFQLPQFKYTTAPDAMVVALGPAR